MAEAELGFIPMDAAQAIAATALTFQPDLHGAGSRHGARRHGGARLGRAAAPAVGAPHGDHVHFGSTSQDVLDTSLVLRLRPVLDILAARLNAFDSRLAALSADHGAIAAMARTRMQRALPITWADRIAAWRAPLARHQKRLQDLKPRLLVVQFGGPVGTWTSSATRGRRSPPRWRAASISPVPAICLAQRARHAGGIRRLAVAGDRQPGQDRPGHRPAGAERDCRRDGDRRAASPPPCITSRTRCWPRSW